MLQWIPEILCYFSFIGNNWKPAITTHRTSIPQWGLDVMAAVGKIWFGGPRTCSYLLLSVSTNYYHIPVTQNKPSLVLSLWATVKYLFYILDLFILSAIFIKHEGSLSCLSGSPVESTQHFHNSCTQHLSRIPSLSLVSIHIWCNVTSVGLEITI